MKHQIAYRVDRNEKWKEIYVIHKVYKNANLNCNYIQQNKWLQKTIFPENWNL